jgi:transcriptional regulator with XRE-family HTH domain
MEPQQGMVLVALRKAKHLTQAQLATLAAMNRSTLAHYERGALRCLPAVKLYRLARALDTTMDDLFARLHPEEVTHASGP